MSNPRIVRWPLAALPLAAFPLLTLAFQTQQPPAQPPAAGARGGRAMTPEQQAAAAALQQATQADHQRMMDLLQIKELRRGRDGNNKDSPYYANFDESKANPFPALPDPLKLNNGKPVKTATDWWDKRRPEIVEYFDREIYGRVPRNVPKVTWEVISTADGMNGDIPIVTKTLKGHVDNSADPAIKVDIDLMLVTPSKAAKPVPVVIQFGFIGVPGGGRFGPPPPAG